MTLIAAAIDGTSVAIVGDTKITFDDDAIRSARLFEEALPKLVLLRDELIVGIAGAGPARMIEDLVAHRDDDLLDLLDHLRSERDGDFVVGALSPARLWRVRDGRVERVQPPAYAWAGDEEAFNRLRDLAGSWGPDVAEDFRLMSSMDQLVSPLGRFPTVGGFGILAAATDEGFRFAPSNFTIFGTTNILDSYSCRILPGMTPTPGALGIFATGAGAGRLFTHEQPWVGIKVLAADADYFAERAKSEYGQTLFH